MPSKTSKRSPSPRSQSSAERICSESELKQLAVSLAREFKPGDRVILEGPLGAGKTTFARSVIEALGVEQPPEGSPTFAIAHEYSSARGGVVHVDLYRLKSETEIDDAGIPDYFWGREAIVIVEWLSMWTGFESAVMADGRNWKIEITDLQPTTRKLKITRP